MAATKYYVWSPINMGDKVFEPGKVVSAKDFPDDWDQLLDSGAVSTKVYPKMPETFQGSPRDFRLAEIKALQDGLDMELDDLEEDEDEQVV